MRPLTWVGGHASALLLLGFVTTSFLPVSAETMRPLLPPLVVLVTALGFARQPLDPVSLRGLLQIRHIAFSLVWLVSTQVLAAFLAVSVGRAIGATPDQLIFIAAFFAAPPMSSAPNICLILGFDHAMSLRIAVLGTLCAPILMPLTLSLSGMVPEASGLVVGLRVFSMLLSGIVLGTVIHLALGPVRIARHALALNGLAALAMIAFLIPLMSGAMEAIVATPHLALGLLSLAVALNILGNLLVRLVARLHLSAQQAATLGYLFGNRNLSLVLASVPFDPILTLFVALMQAPIYGTPALFSFVQRTRRPWPPSSEF
ncbi:MAG: hypothetical protein HWE33_00720 [Rhodobacteraceae bacterium]|nr:hypothetical protein [Paracoccaceae bacterium]